VATTASLPGGSEQRGGAGQESEEYEGLSKSQKKNVIICNVINL